MKSTSTFFVGEFLVAIDGDYRLTLPVEFQTAFAAEKSETWVLAKERAGALSLWSSKEWAARVGDEVAKIAQTASDRVAPTRLDETRRFVRLLSARSAEVKVSPKGRMTIPSECRDFLAVKVPGTCVVVGSGVAIELWQPETWHDYLKQEIENFSPLFERLTT